MTTAPSRPPALLALAVGATLALSTPDTPAQLTDLQPGRNFPTVTNTFGGSRSENLDVGDVDHDGDYDVVVANGGDGAPQANVIYVNDGNAQGGTEGSFTDDTAARFLGVPADTSRDIELVDLDGDTDLDVFISNRGNVVNGGEVSRAYRNRGGRQQGPVGFYLEDTNAFWGTLVAVPITDEVGAQDGEGPFRAYSCDCDFADLDGDGDLDLFHSNYGPSISGGEDSRIFLNDGSGRFDELWPWVNPGADIRMHALDADLVDLDGDFDLDVIVASRESQSRLFRNNHSDDGWTTDPFTDVTQEVFITPGITQDSVTTWESEFGDLDADGDFDLWMMNYDGFSDVTLRNDGDLGFAEADWLRGDPSVDEYEVDFLDYDADGDLDAFVANFSGTNHIYQSARFDGLTQPQGMLHRTGTSSFGSLAPWNEGPTSLNGGTTLDGECADMDGDGDTDILLANDANQQNRYWENALGVPDTHAPTFFQVTDQADKSDGSDTAILAQVRDNASFHLVAFYVTELVYTVDGGLETCVRMNSMGGMQFRGVIPGGIDGAITYRVECTDDAGNTGVSATFAYQQTSSGTPLWQNLGCGTAGSKGVPRLALSGSQLAGEPVDFALVDAHAGALFLVWLAFAPTPTAALGGTVYAFPFDSQVFATTDGGGMRFVSTAWPAGVPTGTEATWQCVVADPTSLHGLTLSNAVRSISP